MQKPKQPYYPSFLGCYYERTELRREKWRQLQERRAKRYKFQPPWGCGKEAFEQWYKTERKRHLSDPLLRSTFGLHRRDQRKGERVEGRMGAEQVWEQQNTNRSQQRELGLRLINIGYKELARRCHPDTGGSHEQMARLNHVRDRLRWNA